MKIGILETGTPPSEMTDDFPSYGSMFAGLLAGNSFEFEAFDVENGIFPDDVRQADGWLITGSRHGAYEAHDWIPPLEEFLRDAYAKSVPIVGICFGHQILAQALGGTVEKFNGGWAVGPVKYHMTDGSHDLEVMAWHKDQVTKTPKDAQVIGANTFCENAILVYGNRALSYQPHPEFDAAFVDGLARTRGKGVVPDQLLAAALSKLNRPLSTGIIADQIADFFHQNHDQGTTK